MTLSTRLLGMAFAAADVLIELDEHGVVRFALGAGPTSSLPVAHWVGQRFTDCVTPDSANAINAALKAVKPGFRSPPVSVELDCKDGSWRKAQFRAFHLPELAPSISCSVSYLTEPSARSDSARPVPMADALSLLDSMRQSLAHQTSDDLQKLALAFVDVAGMEKVAASKLPEVYAGLTAALQAISLDGRSAGRLSDSRYALICTSDPDTDIDAQIRAVAEKKGTALSARTGKARLGADAASTLRAMRFAIEACLRDDSIAQPEVYFAQTLQRTLEDAERFRTIVRDREFTLNYQPIVDLKTRSVHHFEALSRFKNTNNPAPIIRMAEELSLIGAFDRTVMEMAIKKLLSPGSGLLKIAVNVSGVSLSNDDYASAVLAMTETNPEVRQRIMVEVTETAALAELTSANRRLNALRSAGIKICIDDFGVGSSNFDYLRGLNVDIVKIDGSLIRGLGTEARNSTLIAHLVELGKSLNLKTVGEMVETEEQAAILQSLGVDYAQGWLFGQAEPKPKTILDAPGIRGRRKGVIQTWG